MALESRKLEPLLLLPPPHVIPDHGAESELRARERLGGAHRRRHPVEPAAAPDLAGFTAEPVFVDRW
jgi:hypothetical protein